MNTENNENQKEKKTSQQMHKVKTIIIDTGKIRQTKAFARQDGAILGAVWIVSFVCTMLAVDPQYQMLGIHFQHSHHSNPICCGKATEGIP